MRKAQLAVGQIFVYVIALVVAGFILTMGAKALLDIWDKKDQADYLTFQAELEKAVKLTKGYGDSIEEVFDLPKGYSGVCFATLSPAEQFNLYPLIKNSLDSGVKKNVFLVRSDKTIDSFYIENLEPRKTQETPDILSTVELSTSNPCITLTGEMVKIRLEGKGDKTAILTFT